MSVDTPWTPAKWAEISSVVMTAGSNMARMVSYADQLYLMQLAFEKREQSRRDAVAKEFQAIRDEGRRLEKERKARGGQVDAAARNGAWGAWEPREFQIGYDEDDEEC